MLSIIMISFFHGAACGGIGLRGVSLQSEASDNKQELDLRGSKLASFDEVRELWTQGKLNWTTELRNTTAGGRGAVGWLTDRCNMIQYDDPTRIKHKQIRNDLETA